MLRILRLLIAFWILVAVQTALVPSIRILDVGPDLPFVLVILVALREGGAGGALAGFVAGLFVDLNSPHLLGVSSLVTAVLGFVVGSFADRLVRESWATRVAVVFLGALLRDVFVVLGTEPAEIGRALVRSAAPGALYTALLAVPLMALLERAVGWEKESGRGRR